MDSDDEDNTNPLGPAIALALAAVDLGDRANAAGDSSGARDLFACAARLVRKVRGLSEVADFRLERALEDSEEESDAADAAEALRDAFDSLLPDDSQLPIAKEPLEAAQQFIQMAISIGAPAYNLEDRQGCFDVYSCTARMILATNSGSDDAQKRLREALDECKTLVDTNQQAWAMRRGFDAVLEMAGNSGPKLAAREVRQLLATAISIGAPAFDLGDPRGCYEVYACTARLLINSPNVAGGIKNLLGEALKEAAVVSDVARQAWVLRHSFDAIITGAAMDSDSGDAE